MDKFIFKAPNEIGLEGDPRYKIIRHTNPWDNGIGPKVSYQVMAHMYGPWNYTHLRSCHTLLDAIEFVIADANAVDVFVPDDEGAPCCRWCGLERSYLERVPAWWFGCNLCESEMDKYRADDPHIEKVVYGDAF